MMLQVDVAAQSLTVMGAHFSSALHSASLRVGVTAAAASDWISDSAVQARVPLGVGGTRHALLTLFLSIKDGSLSEFFSFDTDMAQRLRSVNSHLSATASFTVIGTDFGSYLYTSAVRHIGGGAGGGAHTAMEATEWVSDTTVAAKRGVFGFRASAGVRVTSAVFSGAGSVTHAHSYLLPVLSSIFTTNQPPRLNIKMFGGYWEAVNGTGTTRMNGTNYTNTTGGGGGGLINSTSALGNHSSNGTVPNLYYGSSTVAQRYVPQRVYFQGGLLGEGGNTQSFVVGVSGAALGVVGHTHSSTVPYTVSEGTAWASDSSIFTQTATNYFRATRRVLITAGIQGGSTSEFFSFDAPVQSLVLRSNTPGTGSASVTVAGFRFAGAGKLSLD